MPAAVPSRWRGTAGWCADPRTLSFCVNVAAHRQRVQVQRAMRQHDALRRAGAAAGVEELRDGVLVNGEEVDRFGMPCCEQFFVLAIVQIDKRSIPGQALSDISATPAAAKSFSKNSIRAPE